MSNITYIKICKCCNHYPLYKNEHVCPISGKRQLINVANNCSYFEGEKYAFDRNKAHAIGERPSTFSKLD